MSRALAALGLVASVLVLAGCAAAPPLPEPLTPAEVKQRLAEQQSEWWQSMFPDEPQPVVDVVEFADPDSASNQVMGCMRDANIDGVSVSNTGFSVGDRSPASQDIINRTFFVCSMRFPPNPADVQYFSEAENEWMFDYNQKRLVPCLQMMGYTVLNREGEYVEGSADAFWSPYFEMSPIPSKSQWELIDAQCPPSPIGYEFERPTRN